MRTRAQALSRRHLEALRDHTFHRLPKRRVRGERSALRFLRQVGFCFTFSTFGYAVPCLWVAVCGRRRPRWPRHTHHDPAVLLTWDLKDTLPAKRLARGEPIQGLPGRWVLWPAAIPGRARRERLSMRAAPWSRGQMALHLEKTGKKPYA